MRSGKCRLVLTTGRTGTVFLAKALQRAFPDVLTLHEPGMSRYQYLLGNLTRRWPAAGSLMRAWYRASANKHNIPGGDYDAYVEINPFLCSFVEIVAQNRPSMRVVHLVRHPYDWIYSMSGFRASGWRRHVIDFVPFNYPPAARQGRTRNERLAHRWVIYNTDIARLEGRAESYELVRFEELFSDDSTVAAGAWKRIIAALDLGDDIAPPDFATKENVNPRQRGTLQDSVTEQELERVKAIVAPLATQFGYVL